MLEGGVAPRPQGGDFTRILKNTASILVSDAAGEILTGYSIALAAISLGPFGFGTLSEAQAFLEPFEAIATFGLIQVAITMAAQRAGCDGTLRGSVLGLRLGFSIVAALLSLGVAAVTGRGELVPLLIVLGVGMLAVAQATVEMLPFQCEQAMHRLLALPFLASLVRVGTSYAAVRYLNRPIGFLLSGLAAGATGAALYTWIARRHYPSKLRFDWGLAWRITRIAWPAAIEGCVVMAYSRGNYFFLHSAHPLVKGEYAAADRMLRPLLGVAAALFVSSLPTFAALAEERDFKRLRRMFGRSVLKIVQVLVVLVAVAWYFSAWLLNRFAPEYAGAIWPFRILFLGSIFMFLNQLSRTYIVAMGRFRTMMIAALVNFAVYIALAQWLIPRYAASGAALALTVMEGMSAVVLVWVVFAMLRPRAPGEG